MPQSVLVGRGGEWQRALSLFEAMQDSQISPNIIGYSAMISACGNVGEWQQALSLFAAAHRGREAKNGDIGLHNVVLDSLRVCDSKTLAGHIFMYHLLPILKTTKMLKDEDGKRIIDLHGLSEESASFALKWWLSSIIVEDLMRQKKLRCIIVTGWGKSRRIWKQSDLRAVVLKMLKDLQFPATIGRENRGRVDVFLKHRHLPKLQSLGNVFER